MLRYGKGLRLRIPSSAKEAGLEPFHLGKVAEQKAAIVASTAFGKNFLVYTRLSAYFFGHSIVVKLTSFFPDPPPGRI